MFKGNGVDNGDGTTTETFDDGSTITYDADGNVISTTDATDGTYTETFDDGSTITYDAEGNVISTTESTDEDEIDESALGDEDGVDGDVVNDDGSVTHLDGSTTYTYDDGSTITVDANGDIIGSTDSSGEESDFGVGDTTGGMGEGFIENDDGTFTYTFDDGSTAIVDADGNMLDFTESTDDTTVDETADSELTEEEAALGYFQDEDGNIYDENGDLVYDAASDWTEDEIADYEYTDEYGNVYDFYGNLTSEADHSDYVYTDEDGNEYDWDGNLISEAPVEDEYVDEEYTYTEDEPVEDEYAYDDSYDYGDYDVKKGGLITMMKRGGNVRHFEDGGYSDTEEEVQDWQNVDYNYGEEDDPTMTGDLSLYANSPAVRNTYTTAALDDGETVVEDVEYFDDGSYIEYLSDGTTVTYDSDGNIYEEGSNDALGDDSGNYTETFDDGSTITYNADGEVVSYTEAPDESGSYTQVFDDGSSITFGADGSVIDVKESPDYSITGAGSGDVRDIYRDTTQTPAEIAREKLQQIQQEKEQAGILDTLKEALGGSGYMGAGAAGAVLGALLGNSDLFSGGGSQNQGIDMSKVGDIAARTTDFGIGPANYTAYQDYAARDEMPDLYGDELYRNLNAPGFNPVNEGDYGYEEDTATENTEPATGMANGGLSTATQTHYTFGKPVDPLENLRLAGRARVQPQPVTTEGEMEEETEEMPEEDPMVQEMRKGGLPALSNVPFAEGRLDFRKGSSVHGPGDGQSDDIPAMLADGEYVIDAETVAQIGNGSTKAGAQALDKFRENIRAHKRSAPVDKIPPKTKALTSYLKGK